MTTFHRFLNPSETAFTYCNEQSPLSVVIAIFYKGPLSDENIRSALNQLQKRHQLLQCGIGKHQGRYFFEKLPPTASLPLQVVPISVEQSWKDQTQLLLNTTFGINRPLLNAHFLRPDASTEQGQILLHLHHALIDGISARLLLSEFLQLIGGETLNDLQDPLKRAPSYPKPFQKWQGLGKRLRFLFKEIQGERQFYRKGLRSKIPSKDQNAILSIELDKATSTRILRRAGTLRISPNSLISAAMLQAIYKKRGTGAPQLMRSVAFADMRKRMEPPVEAQALGCHIAMTRFSVTVSSKSTLISIAQDLWQHMYLAGKKGDLYFFSQLATRMMKVSFGLKKFRLANAALSYIGPLQLKKHYGPIELLNIRTYITNNRLGPSITAFGKYLFGKISLDLNYLTYEFEEAEVLEMVQEIKASLEDIV